MKERMVITKTSVEKKVQIAENRVSLDLARTAHRLNHYDATVGLPTDYNDAGAGSICANSSKSV